MASYGRGESDISTESLRSNLSIDEAYRRVGHKLSQRVGGDDSSTAATVDLLGDHPMSAFSSPRAEDRIRSYAELGYDRTAKVAKTGYEDHGSHQKLVPAGSNILKNLTYHAKETFATIMQEAQHTPSQAGKKRISPTDSLSPHRRALSDLGLEDVGSSNNNNNKTASEPKGLLQAALEGGTSANSNSGSSTSTAPMNNTLPIRGKCLTQPSKSISNDGLDNADGNLIVYENDRITVPSRSVHSLLKARNRFRVIGMLGQGTFAQVFKCQCLQTGDIVAVKIVKNKPAYTRQAAVEIDVFTALNDVRKENMVRLQCYFMYQHHLCLVFELLGVNLYEVLKKRQFRGLPLTIVRSLVSQVLDGVKDLSQKSIVHCDLKPENILLSNEEDVESIVGGETRRSNSMETSLSNEALSLSVGTPSTDDTGRTSSEASSQIENALHRIKLIDLGSACFEGHTSHTYIQSRFYRSPEVLIGVPYDSAIDMWSLGCVAAELFLGLPILPGVHEHDQLGRIREMIGPLPDRMVEQGSKSKKYFVKQFVKQSEATIPKISTDLPPRTPSPGSNSPAPPKATWRLKSRQEYIQSLSDNEIRRKGGLAKLQKQQTNRYFKRTKLADIIMLQGQSTSNEDKESLGLFVHFLLGVLDPDPLKRWTAYQSSMHPFITGRQPRRKSDTSAREFDICWAPPWDPAICRRKLLDVQRTRERQRALRRSVSGGIPPPSLSGGRSLDAAIDELSPLRRDQELSPSLRRASRPSPSVESFQFNRQGIPQILSDSQGAQISPPSSIGTSLSYQNYATGSIPQYHLPPNVNDVRMIGSLPQTLYASSASFTEYNTVAAVEQRVALSSMMLSGGYNSYGESSGLMMQGQSYSAVHGNNMHNSQHEADFGYALQRPGVVPSMDLSFSGASNLPPPQFNQVGYESSNRQMPPEHQRSRSFTHSGGVAGLLSHGRRASHGSHELSERQGLSQYMIQQGMCSATSIKEDANDYVLGGSMESGQSSLLPARSSIGSSATSSLLAQQLEGLSADSSSGGHYMSSQPPTHLGAVPVAAPPQVPATGLAPSSYGPGMPYLSQSEMPASVDSAGYYYTTYITPNGAVMSAPVNMDIQSAAAAMQMHSYGSSYGSYADHQQFPSFYAPPSSLHPQMTYPLSGLQQPPFEESRQNGPPPPHANRNNYYQHHRK